MIEYGSPIPHQRSEAPKRPDLRKPSRPTMAEQSSSYRNAMRDAGRGRLLP